MAAGAGDSLGVATLTLAADPAPLDATLSSVQKRTEARMNAMEAMSGKRVATVGQNMSRLGSQWTRTVSLPIIGGGAAMIKVAADFEAALTQVQTQAGASAKEIHGMREAILKLAPQVGKTPVELANALFHIESAGLRGAKALDVMTQSAKLAQIGHSDLESTTSALVAVMRSAPKDVKNATDAIGIMNAVVGQGNLRMNDLVGALSTGLIPRAKSVGLGLRDVGAALDVMTARGIPAQAAATRLNMTLSLMSAPTSKAAVALESVGIKGSQLAHDMRRPDGLVVAVEDLKKHMDAAGLSATQQNQLISKAFGGGRTSGAMLTLIQNTGDLQKAFDGIGKHSGAKEVADGWKKTQEDTAVRWEKMKAKASVEFIDIGEKIAPTFLRVAGQIADDATGIAKAFTSLPKGAQDLIITGALTAAAMGPALRLAGVLTTFVGRTWDALKVATALLAGERGLTGRAPAARALASVGAAGTAVGAAEGGAAAASGGILSRVVGGAGIALFAAPIAIALGVAVNGWIKGHALDEGRAWADRFTAPLPDRIRKSFRDGLAKARQAQEDQPTITLGDQAAGAARGGRISPAILPAPTAADRRRVFNQYFNLGFQAGHAVVAGLQGVKFTSAPILIRDFIGRLQALPARARPEAAKAMIAYAEELQRQGKLPKRSVDSIIATLEQQFPQLGGFLARQGLVNDQTFARALKFDRASAQLKRTLSDYRTNFGDWAISSKITAGNIDDNVATAMKHLRDSVAGSSGDARKKYQAELDLMHRATNRTYDAMAAKVESSAGAMKKSIQHHTGNARQIAIDNFAKFQSAVYDAMRSGTLSTASGAAKIEKALNATLKALGVKQIPVTTLDSSLPKPVLQKSVGGAAGGGMFQIGRRGFPGRDTVPMSIGGQDVMVGEGETAVIFNRHQMPEVNARFADQGGLPGFFAARRRPNYLAGGGVVVGGKVSTFGPPTEGAGTTATGVSDALPGISLRIPGTHFADPRNEALKNHLFHVAIGSHSADLRDIDIGPNESTGRSIDVTGAGARAMGINPFAFPTDSFGTATLIGNAMGLTGGVAGRAGAAGAAALINAPGVRGTGTIPSIVRAALKKAAAGANAYEQAHMPAPSAGGGGGGGGGPEFPIAPGPVPPKVQWALAAARSIAARHPAYGHMGAGWGLSAYDCSSYVSTVMDAAGIWPKWTYHTAANPINRATDPGPGKWITIATLGHEESGQSDHTMMEIDGHFFESGGGGGGPHTLSGWSSRFDRYGHPRGFSRGGRVSGRVGEPGYQPSPADARILSGPHSAKKRALMRKLNLARGGIIPSFAGGGIVQGFSGGGIPRVRSIHRQRPSHSAAPTAPLPPLLDKTTSKAFDTMTRILGDGGANPGEVAVLQDRDQSLQNIFGTTPYAGISTAADAIVTPPTGDPYIDQNLVRGRLGQLGQMLFIETGVEHDLETVWRLLPGLLVRLQKAIKERKKRIELIKKRIRENLRKIKALQALISKAQDTHQPVFARGRRGEAQRRAWHAAHTNNSNRIKDMEKAVRDLKDENEMLGGSRDAVGTGGEIGKLSLDALTTDVTAVQSNEQAVGGASGIGGSLGAAKIDVLNTQGAIAGFGPNAMGLALASSAGANAASSAAATPTVDTSSQLASLLQTQNDQLSQTLAVSQGQYRALSQLPPFGGSFLTGGVVPGMLGEARTVIAHGGETINPPGSSGDVHVHIDRKSDLDRLIDVRVEKVTRDQARSAAPGGRSLPGARAGQLGRR